MSINERPTRILQVVHGLVPGGIETWLVNVLKNIDRNRFQIDFLTSVEEPCFHDATVRKLGAKIRFCPQPHKPWIFAPALLRIIQQYEYDVVHTHLDHYGGFVLRLADHAGVRCRIAHSHSDTSEKQRQAGAARKLYLRGTKRWISRCATQGLAVSNKAGAALFPDWGRDERWRLFYCGIDTAHFHKPRDPHFRESLGLDPDAIVLGHVGGFREPKNHSFLIDITAAAVRHDPRVRLILVGDGPLRAKIEDKIRSLRMGDNVIATGLVSDPSLYLQNAFDVFVFPSLWEGLPLAVIEAQAAGVPAVISDRISEEVDLVPALLHRLSPDQSPEIWADAILDSLNTKPVPNRDSLAEIEASHYSIATSVKALEEIYAGS